MKFWAIHILAAGAILTGQATDIDKRQDPVVQAVAKVLPCVVNISTDIVVQYRDPFEDYFEDFWGRQGVPQQRELHSLGSGVVVDSAGFIVTNAHVVARATKIHVRLSDGKEYEGKKLIADERNDLALVKINTGSPLPAVRLVNEEDLFLGETVIAVGNPFGLAHTVTKGILSAKNRKLRTETGVEFNDFLQTDAGINPGNSGGALVDINAKLIGINTAIKSPTQANVGIGFAIPARRVEMMLGEWLGPEAHGLWLGAHVEQTPLGLIVISVEEASPAWSAGLVKDDRIAQVDGIAVDNAVDFFKLLRAKKEGDKVRLAIVRGNTRLTVETTLAHPPEKPKIDAIDRVWQKLGFKVANKDGKLVVSEIEANGPADKAGIKPALVLVGVNNKAMRTVEDLGLALESLQKGDRVTLTLERRVKEGPILFTQRLEVTTSSR